MNVLNFSSIDSTSKYIKENVNTLENFSFVNTDYQTNGKGRFDRRWISSKKKNLLFSFLIKEKKLINKYNVISLYTSYLIASFLISLKIKNVKIKWPNDVYVNDKKICGILLEGKIPEYIIVGIGLNVNQKKFDKNLIIPPTSICLEKNIKYDLSKLKDRLFKFLYNKFKNFDKSYLSFVNENNYLLNKKISYELDNKNYEGIVLKINSKNELVVNSNNQKINLNSGEVKIRK